MLFAASCTFVLTAACDSEECKDWGPEPATATVSIPKESGTLKVRLISKGVSWAEGDTSVNCETASICECLQLWGANKRCKVQSAGEKLSLTFGIQGPPEDDARVEINWLPNVGSPQTIATGTIKNDPTPALCVGYSSAGQFQAD